MKWLLVTWIVLTSGLLSWLFGFHMVAFRALDFKPSPSIGFSETSVATDHFLNAKCGCSEKVIDHLIKRGPIVDAHETIYLIDGSEDLREQIRRSGFALSPLTQEEAFEKYQVAAVPLLRIVKGGKELYSGAYGNDQKHSPIYRDEEIIAATLSGMPKKALPIFGCANGRITKNKLDFFGIKYDRN